MKKVYLVTLLILLTGWSIGFFLLHAAPAIHTLLGLSILVTLHAILAGDFPVSVPARDNSTL